MSFYYYAPDKPLHPGESRKWDVEIRVAGTLADPDSSEVFVQVYDSGNNALLGVVQATRSSAGLYYYEYAVDSGADEGKWKITFTYDISATTIIQNCPFEVYDFTPFDPATITTVTAENIRGYIGDVPKGTIKDSQINAHITLAGNLVDAKATSSADSTVVLMAKFLKTCITVYALYIKEFARIDNFSVVDARIFMETLVADYDFFMSLLIGTGGSTPSFIRGIPVLTSGSVSQLMRSTGAQGDS